MDGGSRRGNRVDVTVFGVQRVVSRKAGGKGATCGSVKSESIIQLIIKIINLIKSKKMTNKVFLFALLMLFVSSGNAQVYKGVLITKPNGAPVEYANIGIVEKNIGTTSNLDGRFELKIPSENLKDSIRFSVIGYETITWVVSDFINRNNDTIWMAEKAYSISEVVISPYKSEIKSLGNHKIENATNTGHMALAHGGKGIEIGVILDMKKGTQAQLQTLIFHGMAIENVIRDESGAFIPSKAELNDTLRFRVNLYRVNSKGKFENILTKPIYINYKAYDFRNRSEKEKAISSHPVEFDISEHQLVIDSKSLITLEFYSEVPNKVWFRGIMRGPPTYFRVVSQGKFYKYSMNVSMGLDVKARVMKR
jgi:hypothetical protein